MRSFTLSAAAVCLLLNTVAAQETQSTELEAIRNVLEAQQEAWNRGDYVGFMDGYWQSDSLTFASNGSFNTGWQTTLDNYRERYPDRAAMGILTFTLYEVKLLSDTSGFVFGRYELERDDDHPTGLFTLLLRKFDDGWKVVFDHTSSGG